MTTNQARDRLLYALPLTTSEVHAIKILAQESNEARRMDACTYLRCPRCYGHHSVHGNFDNLCDQCLHHILQYFPNHDSVPHIKATMNNFTGKDG